MMYQPSSTTDLLDWETLRPDAITLTPHQIERAVQLSQAEADPDRQWLLYLNALGLMGFEQWLDERASNLVIADDPGTLFHPSPNTPTEAICNLHVGDFKLCLVATGSLTDTQVSLPKASIDSPEYIPHLYVVVEVLEEQEQVRVSGYLRRDQLITHQQTMALSSEDEATYSLPLSWFDLDSDALLLTLRCLETSAIPLSTVKPAAQELDTQAQRVERGVRVAMQDVGSSLQELGQRAMNVGLWLRDQLDDVAQELSWVLMPTLTPATSAMRSIVDEFQTVASELERSGVAIAPESRAAYRDLHWSSVAVRLYAVIWALPVAPGAVQEWSLLLVLGPQPETTLPLGVGIRVQDQEQILVERQLTSHQQDGYLYAQVIGTWEEQFWVTVNMGNGAMITLPPFAFQPNRG